MSKTSATIYPVLDLFAGPGGWSEGLRSLGMSDLGIEWDEAACKTRKAAGHLTIRADVSQYPIDPFVGKVTGLIASPPCQDFSMAGKRAGRTGDKGQLIDEVPRWVDALRPEWIACEQVPPALEVWEEHAEIYRRAGYSAWCGILNAADFGVPQTRKRAILIASSVGAALPPEPTHSHAPRPALFGPELMPWVSMADALGWGMSARPGNTLVTRTSGGGAIGSVLDGGSGSRRMINRERAEGRWVVDRRTNSKDGRGGMAPTVTVPMSRPAPALTGKAGGQWMFYRPATTVCADPRIGTPGHRDREGGEPQSGEGSVKLTVSEALTLQSFPADYPVQGTKTKQFEQIGNAVPPALAAAVVGSLVGADIGRIGADDA